MSQSIEREQLPDLNDEFFLTKDQIDAYDRDGHTIVRGLVTAEEMAAYRPVIRDIVFELNHHTKPIHERDTYGKAFIQIGNLWQKHEVARRFVLARRFAKVAADLMGVKGIRIYHDQALFKEPGGGHTPWHQDQNYWPLATNNTITMWMPLVPISEAVGSMTFVSGEHKRGFINRQLISDESHRTLGQYIEGKKLPTVNYGAMAAGDATFHAGWTLHSAPGNPTDTMREVMTIIYMADETVIAEPTFNGQYHEIENWMPGLKPGDIAASPLNPHVYSRE